ncbi:MAG: hypothetical protein F4156_13820 [Holophagales bacterium]|nr:hypothetical protein [Holophagales bacterium]
MLGALLCLGLTTVTVGPAPAQPADWPNTVTGTLVDERGAPLADVEIVLRPYPSDYEIGLHLLDATGALPEAVDRTISGSDGSYSLSAPWAGPYRIEVWPPVPANRPAETAPLVHAALTPLKGFQVAERIEVPGRHRVAVRVLDADDQPVEGALVIADPHPWRSPGYTGANRQRRHEARDGRRSRLQAQQIYPTNHRRTSRTDADGIARLLMPTEEAYVAVHANDFGLGEAWTQSGRAVFHLERSAGIRLRVRGPEGRLEPGVLIRGASQQAPLAVTDENGEAVVGGVDGSQAIWRLERLDQAFAEVPVPTSAAATREEAVEVRLEAPLRIPGRVVDTASGLPIQGASVWVQGSPGIGDSSGPTGTFELGTRPAGHRIRLLVAASHYRSARTDAAVSDAVRLEEVRIGLEPSVPIHGLVTDSSAAPVAGAKIWATPRAGAVIPGYPVDPSPTTSAPDGTFRVEETAYGYTYRLTAHAPGYAHTLVDLPPFESGRAIEPVQLVLQRGRRVVGTVVDDQGDLVAAAHVALFWPLDKAEFRSSFDAPAAATTTDGTGAFAFPAAAPGTYEIRITHPEYAERSPSDIDVQAGDSDLDLGGFTLPAGRRIHGIVTGSDGQPVAGAAIRARGRYQTSRSAEREATADADGRFRLVGLSSDFVDLAVRATGYSFLVRPGVRTNSEAPVRIELVPGASLHGRVIDNGGNAVVGGLVRLVVERDYRVDGDPRLWEPGEMFPRASTDAEGRFRFDNLVPGTWSAEASHREAAAKVEAIELATGDQHEIELILGIRDRLTVFVTTLPGEPVADAVVQVRPEGEADFQGWGRTDGSGRTQVDIYPGTADVKVEHGQLRDALRPVQLSSGPNELHIALHPGAEIIGSVRSDDGSFLALATVEATTEFSPDTEFHRANTIADDSGAFRVTGLEPGRYIVTARSPGYADGGPAQPIEIADANVDGIEIVLEPGASIEGVVTGLTPSDLAQVDVRAWQDTRLRKATPDAAGDFVIKGVGPGTWRVTARKGDMLSARSVERSATIERGTTEVFVELPFERGLRLAGQVLDSGAPVAGARLAASSPGEPGGQSTTTDNQGRFVLEGLSPGLNQVAIGAADFSEMELRSIELQADLEGVRIELGPALATLSGIVIDDETGRPLDFAQLVAAEAATISVLASGTDPESPVGDASYSFAGDGGRFELELRANAERLLVTREGYENTQIPLNAGAGQRQEGLVIRLRPAAPNQ